MYLFILFRGFEGMLLDYSRQQVTAEIMEKLFNLAEVCLCTEIYNFSHAV